MRFWWLLCVLGGVPNLALADPWEELMGPGKPRLWTDPEGRFSIDLPVGWTVEAKPGQALVYFIRHNQDAGASAYVKVEMEPLPPNVKLRHYATRVAEDMRKMAPGYQLQEEGKTNINGNEAIRSVFTYQARNNVEYRSEVVQQVLIRGERGFVITLETAVGARPLFWGEFQKMMRGFSPNGPGEESFTAPDQKKKRLKAGEMVNPDGVPY